MQRYLGRLLIGATMLGMVTGNGNAGETGHYVNGVEGIKGSSVPEPGFYCRIYNVLYHADTLTDDKGNELNIDFDVMVIVSGHRFIRVMPVKILGADFLMDKTIPISGRIHSNRRNPWVQKY